MHQHSPSDALLILGRYDQKESCQFRVLYILLYNLTEYKRKECVGSSYMVRINNIYVYEVKTYSEVNSGEFL